MQDGISAARQSDVEKREKQLSKNLLRIESLESSLMIGYHKAEMNLSCKATETPQPLPPDKDRESANVSPSDTVNPSPTWRAPPAPRGKIHRVDPKFAS
jgi:hypothetical protein